MTHVDPNNLDELLSAYLDDELPESERADLERRIAADPEVRARLNSLRRTVELVASLPRRGAPADLLGDLTARAEREQLLGEAESPTGRVRTRPRSVVSLLATAALVTITIGGALWVVFQVGDQTATTGEGRQVAMVDQDKSQPPEAARSRGEELESEKPGHGAIPKRKSAAIEKSDAATEAKPAVDELAAVKDRQPSPSYETPQSPGGRGFSKGEMEGEPASGLHVVAAPVGSDRRAALRQNVYAGLPPEGAGARLPDGNVLVLDVSFADASDVRAASDRVKALLVAMNVSPEVVISRADQEVGAATPPPAGPQGARGFRNEARSVEHGVFVHVPPESLPRLLDTVAGTDSRARNVVLSAGPLRARGVGRAKELLAFAGPYEMSGLHYGPSAPPEDEAKCRTVETLDAKDSGHIIAAGPVKQLPIPPPVGESTERDDAVGEELAMSTQAGATRADLKKEAPPVRREFAGAESITKKWEAREAQAGRVAAAQNAGAAERVPTGAGSVKGAAPQAQVETREPSDGDATGLTSPPGPSRKTTSSPPIHGGAALSAGLGEPSVQDRPQTVAVLIRLLGPDDGPSSAAPPRTTQPQSSSTQPATQ